MIIKTVAILLAIGAIFFAGMVTYDVTMESRSARRARYVACDAQADRARTRADTVATIQWCGDHGVIFAFMNPAPRDR